MVLSQSIPNHSDPRGLDLKHHLRCFVVPVSCDGVSDLRGGQLIGVGEFAMAGFCSNRRTFRDRSPRRRSDRLFLSQETPSRNANHPI